MFINGKWLPHPPVAAAVAEAGAVRRQSIAKRQDELLDEALKETFPASDPVSVMRIT
jgi:hypothetical protein